MQRPVWLPEDIRLKVSPRRKNFGIKLNLDGSCELLAPPHVSEAALERAFRSFEPWLKKKREQLSLKRQALPIHSFSFAVGSEFFFLGRQYPLLPDSCGISRRIRFNGSALLTPETDPQNKGFQALMSRNAIAAGGFFGTGFSGGTEYKKVPYAHTDFVFAITAEKFGFFGA